MKKTEDYKEYLLNKYNGIFASVLQDNPDVSIVVPCYNVEDYLEECLISLVKQTYKNIEIICVNDGAIDSTPLILNVFSQIDSRIKIINQQNKGLSGARNTGLRAAKGKYIAFIDSDDWVSENYIEKLHNAIEKNSCDIAAATIIRKRKTFEKYRVYYTKEEIFSSLEDKIKASKIPECCYVWNKLYKASLIKNHLFKEGYDFEDMFWIPEVLKKSEKLVVVPEMVYYYRVNKKSIVKSKQTKKKQISSYKAHKYIIKFFKENNLPLSERYENVTKELHYLFNFVTMKIKEYKGEQRFYLFGFIPVWQELYILCKKIFSISDIDSHKMIYIFGFQIRKKYKSEQKEIILKEKGTTNTKRKTKIILSLTTFPDRINTVHKTIKTLLNQTLKPDEIVLWLAESQFPNKEKELPQELLNLREYGLTTGWCEDIRSYKKIIPSLKKFSDDIIITFDDDIYYDNDVVENLYNSYLDYPDCISSNRCHRVEIKNNKIKPKKNADLYWRRYNKPSFKNTIIGCGGVLYPPHSLSAMVADSETFKKIIPTQDDVWLWAMAVLNNTKIRAVSSYDMQIRTVENTQQFGLCKINNKTNNGLNGKQGFDVISKNYPEIIDIISQESK